MHKTLHWTPLKRHPAISFTHFQNLDGYSLKSYGYWNRVKLAMSQHTNQSGKSVSLYSSIKQLENKY